MKKKILSLLITTMVATSFIACANEPAKVENEEVAQVEETVEEKEQEEEQIDEDAEAVIEVIEGYTHTPEYDEKIKTADVYGNVHGDGYSDYKEAYTSIIDMLEQDAPDCEFTYALAYIDEDDVPELLCNSNDDILGIYLVTYSDKGENYIALSFGFDIYYIEKQNIVDDTGITLGHYYDNLLAIRDGQWVSMGYGERGTSDPWAEDGYDADGNPIVDSWVWDEESLSGDDEYYAKLNLYFDKDMAKKVDNFVFKDEILTQIEEL